MAMAMAMATAAGADLPELQGMLSATRRLARRFVLNTGLHAVAGLVDLMPGMQRRMRSCPPIEDIEYARHGAQVQRLDVLQPTAPGAHPVLIYFHGGGFTMASKRTHRAVAAAYASQGFLVFNVDYRLAPKNPFPAALEDACAAWLWAVDHAGDYQGDSQRMVLAGESAGAESGAGRHAGVLFASNRSLYRAPVPARHPPGSGADLLRLSASQPTRAPSQSGRFLDRSQSGK